MTIIYLQERPLGRVVEHYLDTRRDKDWPLSLVGAIKAIRAVSQCGQLSDDELGAVIAEAAVAKRRNVAFDLHEAGA